MKDETHDFSAPETVNDFSLDTVKGIVATLGLFSVFVAQTVQDFINRNSDSIAKIAEVALLLGKVAARLDEGQKKTVIRCLESGWYPSWKMAFTCIPESEDLDTAMAQHIESHMDSIEEILCGKYEMRADILKMAFAAHRQGQYTLSIPPFLVQAEGICRESLGVSPFARKNGKRQLYKKIPPELYEGFIFRYLQPVVLYEGIAAGITDDPTQLNRNSILHGVSTEYATRMNSLKAISYLSSLSFLLSLLEEKRKDLPL